MRHSLQQVVRGDHQARRAEAALHRPGFHKRLLDRAAVQTFDRHDRAAIGLPSLDEARADQRPVEIDRARAALTLLARVLRPVQAEPFAQHVKEAFTFPIAVDSAGFAVDHAADLHAAPHAHERQRRASTANA